MALRHLLSLSALYPLVTLDRNEVVVPLHLDKQEVLVTLDLLSILSSICLPRKDTSMPHLDLQATLKNTLDPNQLLENHERLKRLFYIPPLGSKKIPIDLPPRTVFPNLEPLEPNQPYHPVPLPRYLEPRLAQFQKKHLKEIY